jgi:hypothetical protein
MKKNNENLENLYSAFNADSYAEIGNYDESEIEMFHKIQKDLGIAEIPKTVTNYMEYFLENIYENDASDVLVRLMNVGDDGYGFDFDIDLFFTDFEEGDWSDDSEEQEDMEEEYGEEGYNLYQVFTKTLQHNFRDMTPFSNGLEYDGSEFID